MADSLTLLQGSDFIVSLVSAFSLQEEHRGADSLTILQGKP